MDLIVEEQPEQASVPSLAVGSQVSLRGIRKVYPSATTAAVDDFYLFVEPGEFVSILGASGSGKSTLLRIVAGLESPSSGEVWIGDTNATDLPPEKRDIGMVFQDYALFPHMTVRDNVRFPLRMRKIGSGKADKVTEEKLKLVGLKGFGSRKPHQLSGGQQQRVALARALSFDPALLLLDEPLSALDKNLRESMKLELQSLHRKVGVTVLFVTHDQGEALALSDRVVIMRDGKIEACGTPEQLYSVPPTKYVAKFLGQACLIEGVVSDRSSDVLSVALPTGTLFAGQSQVSSGVEGIDIGQKVTAVIRPESITLYPVKDGIRIRARLRQSIYSGSSVTAIFEAGPGIGELEAYLSPSMARSLNPNDDVDIFVESRAIAIVA